MFLSEEQAAILLVDRSYLTHLTNAQVEQYLTKLKSIHSGFLLDTGAKLYYTKHRQAFYLTGYHHLRCDTLSMYDHLDILEDYYSWFLANSNFENNAEELEKRKSAYKQYKLQRLRQVA